MQFKINEIIDKLFSFHRFGIKPGLERTLQLCEYLDNPQHKFKSIHIAGTNGKGSTSSMTASILIENGYRTGLYTSPHILKFNERIQINGKLISDEQIVAIAEKILPFAESISATFFEITTVMAFQYFAENNVDIAVIETGMGGRFDSTNVLTPLISVITKIAIDHTEYLGDTLELIAMEKAGIIKENIPVIIGKNDDNISKLLNETAINKNSQTIEINKDNKVLLTHIDKNLYSIANFETKQKSYKNLKIALSGIHQLENVLSVLNIIELLELYYKYSISDFSIRNGLENVLINANLIGRIEIIQENPPIIIDVSHNSNGINALVETLMISPYRNAKWNVLFSALEDKDIEEMMANLKLLSNEISLVQIKNSRACELDNLVNYAKSIFEKVNSNLDSLKIISELISKNEPLIVVGSFYLIEEFLSIIEQKKQI